MRTASKLSAIALTLALAGCCPSPPVVIVPEPPAPLGTEIVGTTTNEFGQLLYVVTPSLILKYHDCMRERTP